MINSLAILDSLPSPQEFFERYWNQKPFVVRQAIPDKTFDKLIAADELAGLSMEETPLSRMVKTAGPQQQWACKFGPFTDGDFNQTGDRDWCLLIQNVEQFHPPTATLLRHFNFAPRWFLDDIMVSYSEPGGSVGPHIDSYHVFLVQGKGKRRWKIARQPIQEEDCIEGLGLKVLKASFEGDEVEMTTGDVLYFPPKFPHEGITVEAALTYSVGFLGPKISELYAGYAQYLAAHEELDKRYLGTGVTIKGAGFVINDTAAESVRELLIDGIGTLDFKQWLVGFFTESGHDEFGVYTERDETLDEVTFRRALENGQGLIKPEYVKFALTHADTNTFNLGFDGQTFRLDNELRPLVDLLMTEDVINFEKAPEILSLAPGFTLLLELYNHQALEFSDSDEGLI